MSKATDTWVRTRAACSKLVVLNQVDSTNTYLAEDTDLTDYSVVISLDQTSGRGRWGREWISRPGEGIAISVLAPASGRVDAKNLTLIPLVVGASVVSVINASSQIPVTMKWPNDIMVGEKKLGGILCEVRRDHKVVVGIGLNLEFKGAQPSARAVSLSEMTSVNARTLDGLVAEIVRQLTVNLNGLESEQKQLVTEALGTINRFVRVQIREGVEWTGVALGIEDSGALRIRRDDGEEISVLSAEVQHLLQIGTKPW